MRLDMIEPRPNNCTDADHCNQPTGCEDFFHSFMQRPIVGMGETHCVQVEISQDGWSGKK